MGLCVLVMQWYLVVKVAYFRRWYEYQVGQPKFNGARIFMKLPYFIEFQSFPCHCRFLVPRNTQKIVTKI